MIEKRRKMERKETGGRHVENRTEGEGVERYDSGHELKTGGKVNFKKKSEGWKERGWRAKQLKDGYNDRMIDKMI